MMQVRLRYAVHPRHVPPGVFRNSRESDLSQLSVELYVMGVAGNNGLSCKRGFPT